MPIGKMISFKVEPNFKNGQMVKIKSIERNFMGSYVHQYLQKFKNTTGVVEKVVGDKQFSVLVKPHGYESYIFLKPEELEVYKP